MMGRSKLSSTFTYLENLRPHIVQIALLLLEALSAMENPNLNYVSARMSEGVGQVGFFSRHVECLKIIIIPNSPLTTLMTTNFIALM
jgi:hypothetical protein